jgi:hypothetical protein
MAGIEVEVSATGRASSPGDEGDEAAFWRAALAKDGPQEILGPLVEAGWRRNRKAGGWRHPNYLPDGAVPWAEAAALAIRRSTWTDEGRGTP